MKALSKTEKVPHTICWLPMFFRLGNFSFSTCTFTDILTILPSPNCCPLFWWWSNLRHPLSLLESPWSSCRCVSRSLLELPAHWRVLVGLFSFRGRVVTASLETPPALTRISWASGGVLHRSPFLWSVFLHMSDVIRLYFGYCGSCITDTVESVLFLWHIFCLFV